VAHAGVPQTPFVQGAKGAHWFPQAPQLPVSELSSAQSVICLSPAVLVQAVSPAAQLH
jgi:hypothetical protein